MTAVAVAGAIIGDYIGFSIGRYGGARLLLRYGHKIRLPRERRSTSRSAFAFVVWTRRKEGELQQRAEREIAGSVAEELGGEESAA